MSVSRDFERVAERLPVGILRTDVRGRCHFINPTACEILGLSTAEALGRGWLQRLAPTDGHALPGPWRASDNARGDPTGEPGEDPRTAEATRSIETLATVESHGVRTAGPRTISLRGVPVCEPEGTLTGWTVVLVDVSEWLRSVRALEDRVRASVRDLRERLTHLTRVSTMGEMASSIAHEVNQPLTAVATYAQACRRLVDAGSAGLPEVQDVLARITHEALRAGEIIHHLKNMVRRQESRWGEADLNDLVRDVAPLADVDARHHDVRLTFDLAPDLPPVLADGVQVQQVVLNLIRNGIDAVEEGRPDRREVRVRTASGCGGTVRLSVEDDGVGVPADVEASLFHPFFTTKKGGMGMGLSISRSIIAAHHGHIGFERRPGGGSTFYFTLPVLDDS